MASFGKVLDLLDDRYLNLQDVTGNVEPMPTLVPYEQYGRDMIVYRMDTEHELFMGLLQDFTMRRANELRQELWTWVVQWEVDNLAASAPSPKKARLRAEQPEGVPRVRMPKRQGPAYTIFERRVLDSELMQEENMLRILLDIVQIDSSIVPNFIEFMYRWIDFYEGDGKALKAALRNEIPSLWEFDYHPLPLPVDVKRKRKALTEKVENAKVGNTAGNNAKVMAADNNSRNSKAEEIEQGSPTKKMLEIPDLAAMERQLDQSDRLKYREVKYGVKPPMVKVPFPPLINIPQDGYERQRYYAACFRSRQRALRLLVEAGMTTGQVANYKRCQKEHPKDTPKYGNGDGMRYYEKDASFALMEQKRKQEDMALRQKTLEISIHEKLMEETFLAASGVRQEALSRTSAVPSEKQLGNPNSIPLGELDQLHGLNKFDAWIAGMAASRGTGKGKIGLVPTPLVQKMKSKLFAGALDEAGLDTLAWRTASESYREPKGLEIDVDMDYHAANDCGDCSDCSSLEDNTYDRDGPCDDARPPPTLPQGLRLPPLTPPPEPIDQPNHTQQSSTLINNAMQQTHVPGYANSINLGAVGGHAPPQATITQHQQNFGLGQTAQSALGQGSSTQGQPHGFPALNTAGLNMAAIARPNQPSSTPTIIHGPRLPTIIPASVSARVRASSATIYYLPPQGPSLTFSAPPVQPNGPTSLPPPPPPPPGFPPLGQTNQLNGQAPQQVQYGNMTSASNAFNGNAMHLNPFTMGAAPANPFLQAQIAPQQQQGTLNLQPQLPQLSTIPGLLPLQLPPGFGGGQVTGQWNQAGNMHITASGLVQGTGLAGWSQPPAMANYVASQQGQQAQANTQAAGQSAAPSITIQGPSQPAAAPYGTSASSNNQNATYLAPPRPGITRNAPSPLNMSAAGPQSPFSSLAPQLLATSPFAIHARPIPIQIYMPSIVVPGLLRGPGGIALGDHGSHATDAMLAGHCVPGSGTLVLSKAVLLPVGVWPNMLRRVQRGAYKVLETYKTPKGHPAAFQVCVPVNCTTGTTAAAGQKTGWEFGSAPVTPHLHAYTALVHALSLTVPSPADTRESLLSKRWRTTPGPMTQRQRGAVWEGWGATVASGIEMTKGKRQGAMKFTALIDTGVDKSYPGMGLAEDEELAAQREREVEDYLDRLEKGELDSDEYMEDPSGDEMEE